MSKIAYIMSRFPHLPETFILREMNGMGDKELNVALYPLVVQKQAVVHKEAESWLIKAKQLSVFSWGCLLANIRYLLRMPITFFLTWGRVLWENLTSPNFLLRSFVILPKSIYAAELMEKEGIRHIHAHYASHPALAAWIIQQFTGISYSVTVHAHDIFVRKAMLKTKLKDASFIASISQYNRSYLAEYAGDWINDKTEIVHCGIMPERYQASVSPFSVNDRLEMISIGSLQPYKGQTYLIEACRLLRERRVPFRCRIIGEGDERPALQKLISEYDLQDSFELLGAKNQVEVAELLATAHCYVQPSIITPAGKMEGIPVSIMEAMACSLPVIATRISGIPELVRAGETGYLVPPADADALASEIATVYTDYETAVGYANAGRQLVYEEFELTKNVALLASLFQRTINQKL